MATPKNYLSLIKFSHTIFALPFALIGFFYAIWTTSASFSWTLLGLVLLCMVFVRSAAMAFNRYLDRDIDTANPRTAEVREIPLGVITPKSALIFVIVNSFLFVVTTYFMNTLVFALSPVALAITLGYSYTKRFTALCHLVLGLGLSLAPVGAYLAVTGEFALVPVLFGLAVLSWVSGFDIIYALQDDEFDRSNNLHSIPVRFQRIGAIKISNGLHVFTFLMLGYAGYAGNFAWFYWAGFLFFTAMLLLQHRLVKPNDLSKINLAFMTTNGIASLVFGILVVLDLYLFSV